VTPAEALRAWIEDSRRRQELPAKIEDEAALLRAAAMILAAWTKEGDDHAAA
jgi:hypothetical protein